MADTTIIQQYLSQALRESAGTFTIPEEFIKTMPDLIELVLESKSLEKNDEKQSRFNLLPLMNEDQITKLRDILTREKQKLAEIEQKYQAKKQEMSQKFVKKFEEGKYQENMSNIKSQEQERAQQDHEDADDLLLQL